MATLPASNELLVIVINRLITSWETERGLPPLIPFTPNHYNCAVECCGAGRGEAQRSSNKFFVLKHRLRQFLPGLAGAATLLNGEGGRCAVGQNSVAQATCNGSHGWAQVQLHAWIDAYYVVVRALR